MRWVILLLLFLFYMLNFADKSVLGLAAEPIMKDLNLDFSDFGIAGSSFYWLFAIGSVLLASASIKYGTKKLLLFLALGWTLSLVSAMFVKTLTGLIIIRVILGFFEGGTWALCIAHLAKWFADGSRGVANAILLSGATFGAYLTAPLLVKSIDVYDWRTTFVFLGISSLVWFLIFIFFKEEPESAKSTNLNITKKDKGLLKDVLKIIMTPFFLSTLVALFSVMWVIAWVVVWAPTYLTSIVGLSIKGMSIAFALIGISAAIGSIIVGKVTDRIFLKTASVKKSYIFASILSLIISALAFGATTITTNTVLAIVFLVCGLTANNCIAPFTASIINSIVPPNQSGAILGIKMGLASFAGILAPIITGYLVSFAGDDIRAGFNYGVLIPAVLYVISAIFLYSTTRNDSIFNVNVNGNVAVDKV